MLATLTPRKTRPVILTMPNATQRALGRLLLGLWRTLDACEAYTRTHGPAEGTLRQALERDGGEYEAWYVASELGAARYLLGLFAGILSGFTAERRPAGRFLTPAARDCGSNDRQHIAAIVSLRYAIEAAHEVLENASAADDALAQQVAGMVAYLSMLESLLSTCALWCRALDNSAAPELRVGAA